MSFFVDAPQKEAFRLVMDFFTGRHVRIPTLNSPSYMRAEFGSWASMSFDNAKGEVEVNLVKRNGGSYVNLNFNFSREYLGALMLIAIVSPIIPMLYGMLNIDFLVYIAYTNS